MSECILCDASNPEETEICKISSKLFTNVLNSIIPNAPKLQHVRLQTGQEHNFGTLKDVGIAAHV